MKGDENHGYFGFHWESLNGVNAGLPLEKNLLGAGTVFLRGAETAPCYRLWSISDQNPAMLRVSGDDPRTVRVAVEVWQAPAAGLASVLLK